MKEIHDQGEATMQRADKVRDVKVSKPTEEDDIEAYLTTFERLMQAYDIPKARWAYKLAPQLVGKAQQAYAAMGISEVGNYDELKAAVLRRYDINDESYQQASTKRGGETNRELVARLEDLATKWMQGCTNMEEVKDVIVKEQLLNSLPEHIRIWVRERKPETSLEAGQLSDDFIQAQKSQESNKGVGEQRQQQKSQCHKCKKYGHVAKECPSSKSRESEPTPTTTTTAPKLGKDLQQVECFNCHQKGHYSSNCPRW